MAKVFCGRIKRLCAEPKAFAERQKESAGSETAIAESKFGLRGDKHVL
jgi:hypothetical protein